VSELGRRFVLAALALLATACGASHAAPTAAHGAPAVGRPLARDFILHDQAGKRVRLSAQRGRFVFLTFLYTHCPDVCPLTAERLNGVLRALGARRGRVRVLAVSVDPRHDTPRAVRSFIRLHRLLPQFRYLTGARSRLERVWIAYNIVTTVQGAGRLFHSGVTLLIDRQRHIRFYYSGSNSAGELHDLESLMQHAT
jgi:protein SCO1/2